MPMPTAEKAEEAKVETADERHRNPQKHASPKARASIDRWDEIRRSIGIEVSGPRAELGDPQLALAFIDRLRESVTSLEDALGQFEDAVRPVDASGLLRRLDAVNETTFSLCDLDLHAIPATGVVQPQDEETVIAAVREGEQATVEITEASRLAENAYASMAKAPLSRRKPLADEYMTHTQEVLRWGSVAWNAIDAALQLIVSNDVPELAPDSLPASGSEDSEPTGEVELDFTTTYPAAAQRLRDVAMRSGLAAALAASGKDDATDLADMAPTVLEAILVPGRVPSERLYDKDIADIFELAHLQLQEVAPENREEMTGLLALASLEGATFVPGGVYTAIIDNAGVGRAGAIAHALRQHIADLVQRSGVPTPASFKAVRRHQEADERISPLVDAISGAIEVARLGNFSYRAALQIRDKLCDGTGFYGRVLESVREDNVPSDLLALASTLTNDREAAQYLDAVATEARSERLFSGGRLKFIETLTSVATSYVEFADLQKIRASIGTGSLTLALASERALNDAKALLAAETDDFAKACLTRGVAILDRFSALVNGRAERP